MTPIQHPLKVRHDTPGREDASELSTGSACQNRQNRLEFAL
jgi:hypothetical protein